MPLFVGVRIGGWVWLVAINRIECINIGLLYTPNLTFTLDSNIFIFVVEF